MICPRFLFLAIMGTCVTSAVFGEESIPKMTLFSQSLGTFHVHNEGFDPHRVYGSIGKYIADSDLIALVEVNGAVDGGKTTLMQGGPMTVEPRRE